MTLTDPSGREIIRRRTAETRYRYRSLTSGFEALVDVDADGLPTEYAGIWRRVAAGPALMPPPARS